MEARRMATEFEPKLSILPDQQRRLWPELATVPGSFVLFGGTAIALQLGHRSSIDFDLLGAEEFDPDRLYDQLPFLDGSRPIQKAASTLTCVVDRGGAVQVSFFAAPSLRWVESPRVASDNRLKVASLLDLAGMKAAVVQKRSEARDYIDMDALLATGSVELSSALSAARVQYGRQYNPDLTLKALSFFGDGNLHTLSQDVRDRLVNAVGRVDIGRLPELGPR
jgi:hypothetical protein